MVLHPGSDAQLAVFGFANGLKAGGWDFEKRGEPGRETVLVIRGSKTSLIKAVTVKGDTWGPTVQRRIMLPPAKPKR
jgi:hypothetical protein